MFHPLITPHSMQSRITSVNLACEIGELSEEGMGSVFDARSWHVYSGLWQGISHTLLST